MTGTVDKAVSRRKFLKSGTLAAGAAAGALAMPKIVRAQDAIVWKYQSTWPTKDIFHEFAVDYAKKVNDMSGGRLKLDVLAAGAVVPAFQCRTRCIPAMLDGGHGVCRLLVRQEQGATRCSARRPSFGWDAHSMLGWFYYGGGEALYNELVNDILEAQSRRLPVLPDADPAARLVQEAEIKSADDFKGMKYRTVGLSADLFKEMGAAVTILPAARSCRRWTAACSTRRSSTIRRPTSCSASRTSSKVFMMRKPPPAAGILRDHLQQGEVQRAAGGAARRSCKYAANSASADQIWHGASTATRRTSRRSRRRGVQVHHTPNRCWRRSSRPGTR